jgi:hypothetical protein
MYEFYIVFLATPVPVPTPVAIKYVPTLLLIEPIKVKSVVPSLTISYVFRQQDCQQLHHMHFYDKHRHYCYLYLK